VSYMLTLDPMQQSQRAISSSIDRAPERQASSRKDISNFALLTNVSPAHEPPRESTGNRCRMSRQNADLPQYALRLVENAELSQHRPPVVIDFLPSQAVVGVKRVHTAKGEIDSSPCCRKTAPSTEVGATNSDFNQNRVICNMSALYLDF
jgi:hypothetical protein